jgi:hypothetical protein
MSIASQDASICFVKSTCKVVAKGDTGSTTGGAFALLRLILICTVVLVLLAWLLNSR